jgi:low affinity Fe/Cu permease
VTLALVFVVQHTQDHDTNVTQRKLDAILAALPDDNEDLLHLETASDEHIDAVAEAHRRAGRRSRGQADETARR